MSVYNTVNPVNKKFYVLQFLVFENHQLKTNNVHLAQFQNFYALTLLYI